MQKHQWWKQSYVRGQVGHGQEFVETIMHARISVLILRGHDMDLATIASHITDVFVTSTVNLRELFGGKLCVCGLHKIIVCVTI